MRAIATLLLLIFPAQAWAVLAFPGAMGYGRDTVGGRGGTIYVVDTLSDNPADGVTLREALEASGARIIVFSVGGVIHTTTPIIVSDPNYTLAGQTAPDPGIAITGAGLRINSGQGIVQHVAAYHTLTGDSMDAIDIHGISVSNEVHDVIVDHVTAAWGTDESLSYNPYSSSGDCRVTLSNNLIAKSVAPTLTASFGSLMEQGSIGVSYIRSLVMSTGDRQARIKGNTTAQFCNNYLYNCGNQVHSRIGSVDGNNLLSAVGNVFRQGPNSPATTYGFGNGGIVGGQLYFADNLVDDIVYDTSSLSAYVVGSPPVSLSNLTILPASQVEAHVLANVGSRPAARNPVDARLIAEVVARGGAIRTSPGTVTLTPTTRDFTPFIPASPHADDDGDGWTNIEEVLHAFAAAVEGQVTPEVCDDLIDNDGDGFIDAADPDCATPGSSAGKIRTLITSPIN